MMIKGATIDAVDLQCGCYLDRTDCVQYPQHAWLDTFPYRAVLSMKMRQK
eukprot:jgi/Botrbrau1/20265/Bobra.31_1s0050.1